jgi:hypothetical protein
MIYPLAFITVCTILAPFVGYWLRALGTNDWRDEAEAERAGVFQNGPQPLPESRHVDLFGDSATVVSAGDVARLRERWAVGHLGEGQ